MIMRFVEMFMDDDWPNPETKALSYGLVETNPRWRVAKISVVPKFRRNEMGKIVSARVREILLAV